MPTEEVFTSPDRRRTEGVVRSTKPLALAGNVVRDLEIRFEAGRAVEVNASSGAELIREQLRQDENACMLGEVALVDGDSRVGRSGLAFLNTLFDENASCHIAYGAGILDAIPAGGDKSDAELEELGFNNSTIHTDFMIGGPRSRSTASRRRDGGADPAGGRVAAVLTGGCGCGAVRYEVSEPFVSASYCHCTRCQRRTGTAASANGRAAPGSFEITAGEEHVGTWAPEGGAAKNFCVLCGSALLQPYRRRSTWDRRPPRYRRRRSRRSRRSGTSTWLTPPAGRRSRTTACRATQEGPRRRRRGREAAASGFARKRRSARSRGPPSNRFLGGRSRRRLRSGETAAPERESLALLPSGT